MTSGNECTEAARVVLVGQSLPVLLRGAADPEGTGTGSGGDISVDLLQQALQGASGMDADGVGDEGESAGEVSLDALSGGNNDVVAIIHGEEGQTHTIKLSLAEAQSLGLNFTGGSFPVALNDGSLVASVKVSSVEDGLTEDASCALSDSSLLQNVTCSNVATEGRIIDEEGNIVETSEPLQIIQPSLSSLLDEGMSQSLSIIPQYELDGTVTYAVKLKDQSDTVLGPDYHVLEPDSSAKTGLDIEEELKSSGLKQNLLHTSGAIGLATSVALNNNSTQSSNAIQMPISTLEALSKQMLLPVSSSSVPISVTLSIPTQSTVPSNPTCVSSNLAATSSGRFFRILTDPNSVGLNNIISTESSNISLNTMAPQQALAVAEQQAHLMTSTPTMLNVQSPPTVTFLGNKNIINQQGPMRQMITDKLPILPAPKNFSSTSFKASTAVKKMPIMTCAVAPAAIGTPSVQSPVMASVAPITPQPILGGAAVSKPTSSSSNLSKPLGSSENPIQLVQQGQTFHSMQALNQAQLRQIATVLQQKHLNTNTTSSKNVLFDEQTKTRIVYRVVYPEDVDLQQPPSSNDLNRNSTTQLPKSAGQANGRRGKPGRPKKTRRGKKINSEKHVEKTDQVAFPSGSSVLKPSEPIRDVVMEENGFQEEIPKVEKKKIVAARTRSGRVSRPPKHMMKDFKRLHHTDYREKDNDASDGGYSDYSNPEQTEKPKEIEFSPAKKKFSRFTCPTCNKLYLGLGRMEKHFLQYPDHGSLEEFKKQLNTPVPVETPVSEDAAQEPKPPLTKNNILKGKKRNQGSCQSEKERSDIRKRKLKQALEACEISEVIEVAGPLVARYNSIWDLLLLRLMARDGLNTHKENSEETVPLQRNGVDGNDENFDPQSADSIKNRDVNFPARNGFRSTLNRVQWLLMELETLADTLQSLAGDVFQPPHLHGNEKTHVEINQKTVSDLLGVSCGMYSVNEEQFMKRIESFTTGSNSKTPEGTDGPPEKKFRNVDEAGDLITLRHEGSGMCPESLSSLSLVVKPVDDEKTMLAKLTEDMPFLNSSDDMICGSEDPDLSTDSKRDHDCDPAAGLQVVDDIVNERLKNLSENMNFSVPIQGDLGPSNINGEQSDLHMMTSFGGAETSIAVSNSSVIPSNLTESSKPAVSVSNMDLMSSYSMPSLSGPGTHDVNSAPSNDLPSLEPVSSQSMLGSFGMGLSSMTSFDTLQSQSSNVPHSEDSFLESLGSFETPLTQSCSSSNARGPSFDDGVMKSNGLLQPVAEQPETSRLPPKFISTFTPAITSDKSTFSISTAQRLQRSYLELDSGLDDGLDLDFEAFTQELSMTRNNSA